MKRVNQQAFFNYLFNGAKGFILYTLYKDYVNKMNKIDNDEVLDIFSIDDEGFVPKAISTFSDYTGYEDDTVRKALKDLENMGFIESRKGGREIKNITSYRPVLSSNKYLQLCNTKLVEKMEAKNEKNRNQATRILEPYIELLSKEKNFLKAIDMYDGQCIQAEAPSDNSKAI